MCEKFRVFGSMLQRIDIINGLGCCWKIYNVELSIYQQMCYGHRVMYIHILLAWWIFLQDTEICEFKFFLLHQNEYSSCCLIMFAHTSSYFKNVYVLLQSLSLSKEACHLMRNMFHTASTWIRYVPGRYSQCSNIG